MLNNAWQLCWQSQPIVNKNDRDEAHASSAPAQEHLLVRMLRFPRRRAEKRNEPSELCLCSLATTLQPGTLRGYRLAVKSFLRYLRANYPEIHTLSALRRAPHFLGWLRSFCEQQPPLNNATRRLYLTRFRRLLNDLALSDEHSIQEGLILRDDFPPLNHYLPKPLSPEDDSLLQLHLRHKDDLPSNALLLLRASGIRIGELLNLPLDCLRHLGTEQWALHVPLGKLHTERLVPVDDDMRQVHARILLLRQYNDAAARSPFLLPQLSGHHAAYLALRKCLAKVAQEAGCSAPVTPHQLRHSYATEMLRAGVSLPAVMQLLCHKTIQMTLLYIQVSQTDLQRQYHLARQNIAGLHSMPKLVIPGAETYAAIPGITKSLAASRHLLEMYRRQLSDDYARRKLQRLANRLTKIATEVHRLSGPCK
jgi:site-specific recombinase XerD